MGFEPMVRSRESLVFKTSSINHSDTSPQWLPPECRYYYTKMWRGCQPLRANFFENYFACESHGGFSPAFYADVFCFGPFSPKKRKNRRSVTPRRENFRGLFSAIPHNSKCRYGERGAAAAKPKAQIILCVLSSILATQMPCRSRRSGA